MNKQTVLITGAAGFIGSHVADTCLQMGFEVVAVDDLSGGEKDNLPEGVIFEKGSVESPTFIQKLFNDYTFTYVYHLAAYAAEGLSHFIRRYNYQTNLIGSINLINESVKHEVKCFVFTSSIAVYGAAQNPMTEDTLPQPEDPYGISKYAVELDLQAAHQMFGMEYIIFRPHNVYGERQNIADRYRNVIGIFMNQVLSKKPMTIFGDGSQSRAFSYIGDIAPVIASAPNVPAARNQVFNIGADTPYSVKELAQRVADAFGRTLEVCCLDARKEVLHAFSDHTKAVKVFGPRPATALAEGIQRMATWARSRGPATPTRFENIEVLKNLPDSWRPS